MGNEWRAVEIFPMAARLFRGHAKLEMVIAFKIIFIVDYAIELSKR
jgi:hypothetical protein